MLTRTGLLLPPSLSTKNRSLLAAALLALGPGVLPAQPPPDLTAIRARAEQGDPEALNALANAYANGTGVPQNFTEALRFYQQAADRGLSAAQFNFGMMHELGRGTPVNHALAFRSYLKAAEQGFAPAQFNVGNMYANGIGVAQDYFEAALWFRQAADRQVPEAQYNLALAYELGRGLAKDEPAAQRWYRTAANQRYARAQYNLALMLEEGRGGPVDPAAAVEYYRAAAAQNFAPAQNNLGILLAEGRGTAPNPVEAYTWLALAVENGTKPTGRDIVAQQLTPAQLAEANTAIARMRPQLGLRPPASTGVASMPTPPAAAGGAVAPVAAATPPPAPAATPPPVARPIGASVAPEVVALNTRVVNAETEVERLRAENSRLADTAQMLVREKSALEQRVAAAAAAPAAPAASGAPGPAAATAELALPQLAAGDPRIARLITDNERLNEEVKRSTVELTQLNRQLRAAQAAAQATKGEPGAAPAPGSAADAGRLAELSRQVDTLTAEKTALERRVAEAASRPVPAAADAEGMQQLRTQLGEAIEQLGVARREAQALRSQAGTAQQADAANRETISGLQAQLADAQTKLTAAQQSGNASATATRQLADVTAQRDALDRQVAQLGTRVNSLIAERDRLAAGGAGAAASRESLDRVNAQLEGARGTITDLNAKNDSLTKDLEVARQSAAAALAAQAAAASAAPGDAMRLEMQTLQQQVRRLEGQAEEDKKTSARDLATLAAQLQSAREANRALGDANRALLQMKGAEDAGTKSELEQANTRLAESERRGAQFRQAAETARAETEKARTDLAALQTRLSETNRAAEQHGSSVAELTGVNDKLTTEKAALEQQVAQLRREAELARTDVTDLRNRVSGSDRAVQEQAASVTALTASNEKLQVQVKDLTEQMTKLRGDNTRLAAAGDTTSLRTELADVRLKLTTAEKAAEQQAASVAELTGANDKLSTSVKDLQTQIAGVQAENIRLAQSDVARQDAEQRAASLTVIAAQAATYQRELATARGEITRLNDSVQNLERDRTTRLAQLQQENAAINARLRQAQGTLDQIASAARLINGGTGTGLPIPAAAPTASAPVSNSPLTPAPAPPRIHQVAEGDTLTQISVRYYGTSGRWQEIYDANRDVLRGENALRPGQRLRIP